MKTRFGLLLAVLLAAAGCGQAASSPTTTAPTASPSGGPSAPPSPSGSTVALPADFPVGTWTMTVTPDDLRAAGITDQGAILENSGTFLLTYGADGTWTVVQQSGDPTRWPVFRGRVSPTGDRTFSATTDFPPEFAGEVVAHAWELDGDELVVRVPEATDPILKANWEAHAWKRAPGE